MESGRVSVPAGCEAGLKLGAMTQRWPPLGYAVQANFPSSPVRRKHTQEAEKNDIRPETRGDTAANAVFYPDIYKSKRSELPVDSSQVR